MQWVNTTCCLKTLMVKERSDQRFHNHESEIKIIRGERTMINRSRGFPHNMISTGESNPSNYRHNLSLRFEMEYWDIYKSYLLITQTLYLGHDSKAEIYTLSQQKIAQCHIPANIHSSTPMIDEKMSHSNVKLSPAARISNGVIHRRSTTNTSYI